MTEKDKTCAERIQDQMTSRNVQIEEIYDKMQSDNDEEQESGFEEYHELPLEIVEYKVIKILLSTGGPADWIEAKIDETGYPVSMEYHFQDWFDHASTKIYNDSYLWQYASEMIDLQ